MNRYVLKPMSMKAMSVITALVVGTSGFIASIGLALTPPTPVPGQKLPPPPPAAAIAPILEPTVQNPTVNAPKAPAVAPPGMAVPKTAAHATALAGRAPLIVPVYDEAAFKTASASGAPI